MPTPYEKAAAGVDRLKRVQVSYGPPKPGCKLYTYDAGDLEVGVGDTVVVPLEKREKHAVVVKLGSDFEGEVRQVIRVEEQDQ